MPATEKLTQILPDLWRFEDTCNVYVVKRGAQAVLIDFGSGAILEHLSAIGVTGVLWILHTHHHRDQCQGDRIANEHGIPIAVPAHELQLFEEVESYWDGRQIYNLYNVRGTSFTLAQSIRTAAVLRDYETFDAGIFDFLVSPTPGHTMGHISLTVRMGPRTLVFSGDLIHAPAHVENLFDLQWYYGGEAAMIAAVYSLDRMRDSGAHCLCPSHGPIIRDPAQACTALAAKLRFYLREQRGLETLNIDLPPKTVLPHLLQLESIANSWIVVSESGKALFVDYGLPSWRLVATATGVWEMRDTTRFLEHNLDRLRKQFGIRQFDVAIPTHYHDDHIAGFPYLQQHHGTRIWCFENMQDVLAHPNGYKLACLSHEPLEVERTIAQGESIRWEEYEFQVFHAPGHTDYHMAMFGVIDGKRVAFSGDNVHRHEATGVPGNTFVPRNHVHADSHDITARLFLEHEPELACSGHNPPLWLGKSDWQEYYDWSRRERAHWEALSPDADVEGAVFPDSISVYPYQARVIPGGEVHMQVRFDNRMACTRRMKFALRLPVGCRATPASAELCAGPRSTAAQDFVVSVAMRERLERRRLVITVDVELEGRSIGEIAEAILDLRPDLEWGGSSKRKGPDG